MIFLSDDSEEKLAAGMEWLRLLRNSHTKWPNELSISVVWATLPQELNFLALMFVLYICAILYKYGYVCIIKWHNVFDKRDIDSLSAFWSWPYNLSAIQINESIILLHDQICLAIVLCSINSHSFCSNFLDNWRLRPACQSVVFAGWLVIRFVDYIWYNQNF